MPYVVLSARAQADIARQHRFQAEKDMQAATRAVVTIRDAFRPLSWSPMIGRPVEERPELRELVIDFGASGYLALYGLIRARARLPSWPSSINSKSTTSKRSRETILEPSFPA